MKDDNDGDRDGSVPLSQTLATASGTPLSAMRRVTRKLNSIRTPEDLVVTLKHAKRIVVISGAGISVSCGIPDFRSKDIGLYNTLDCNSIGIPSAELLFDLEFFQNRPSPILSMVQNSSSQ